MPGKNLPQNSTKTIDNNPGGLVVFSFYSSLCIPSHKLDEIRVLRRFFLFHFQHCLNVPSQTDFSYKPGNQKNVIALYHCVSSTCLQSQIPLFAKQELTFSLRVLLLEMRRLNNEMFHIHQNRLTFFAQTLIFYVGQMQYSTLQLHV